MADPVALVPPPRGSYCLGVISHSLTLVLRAAVSLRATAAIFAYMPQLSLDPQGDLPTPGAIQMWLLRLGLDAIKRHKEQAEDWAWLVDHTVQIGKTKCLLIVGIRLSKWRQLGGEVAHHDLEVIMLEPVEKSDGATVCRQLREAARKTGLPRMIASDHGTDIKQGVAAFQQQYPHVSSCYDIAHKVALLLKKTLEGDSRWVEFTRQCGLAKARLQQTRLAHLIPPSPQPKARYMNADRQVDWGRRVLQLLDRQETGSMDATGSSDTTDDSLADAQATGVLPADLQEKLGWVRSFAEPLGSWSKLMDIAASSRHCVRRQGYHADAAEQLRGELSQHQGDELGDNLIDQVCAFVSEQSASAKPGERLLGSTEILESLIGTGKRLEGQQSKGGFTKMVLSMAAATVVPTIEHLSTALDRTSTKHVLQWGQSNLSRSLQSQRRAALKPVA